MASFDTGGRPFQVGSFQSLTGNSDVASPRSTFIPQDLSGLFQSLTGNSDVARSVDGKIAEMRPNGFNPLQGILMWPEIYEAADRCINQWVSIPYREF